MRTYFALSLTIFLLLACASTTRPGVVGVERKQLLLVSSAEVDQMAAIHYAQQYEKAKSQGRLVADGPELDRLKVIAGRLIHQTGEFRDDTRQWKWHLTLINAPVINATCAPGGKITFYTGIIRKLELTDSEIAAIMGHEIAHALREHGREKVSGAVAQNLLTATALVATRNKEQQIGLANQFAQYLYVLPFSRQMETEADRIGLELAARAGYDPRSALSVWKKMSIASNGQSQPEFLSTHPSHATRYNDLASLMPRVMPLYQAAAKP
jgi:predicted Zn-dependent protease